MDMKDRIFQIADEIAWKEHDCGFYELPENLKNEVWTRAEEQWSDEQADLGDRLLDEFKLHGKVLWVPKRRLKNER